MSSMLKPFGAVLVLAMLGGCLGATAPEAPPPPPQATLPDPEITTGEATQAANDSACIDVGLCR